MGRQTFRFKQFTIQQDRCAMKVGTDGVLLGSWVPVQEVETVLDIGTGTGLLALMIAQRQPTARIDAVEIDAAAAEQAQENVAASQWADRIVIHPRSLQSFAPPGGRQYDLILSNPPFFASGTGVAAPDQRRQIARHADSLSMVDIGTFALEHLATHGRLGVILPAAVGPAACETASELGLHLSRRTLVRPLPDKPDHRWLLCWTKEPPAAVVESELTIETTHHHYTAAWQDLTQTFYLAF